MHNTPAAWTVLSMLEWMSGYFAEKEVNSPRLSAEWLLSHVLQTKRLDLYLNYDRPLSSDELAQLRQLVKRRALHEPLQYIVGYTQFYNAKILVNQSVLIPRQETEQLVDLILEKFGSDTLRALDIGTGSGCIPVALKMNRPGWEITATDISEQALALARENAALNRTAIEFVQQDLFRPDFGQVKPQFDLIISNPPYILKEEEAGLDREVKEFEPGLALYCSSTEHIFSALEQYCSDYLAEKGAAFFEIHSNYAAETEQIFIDKNWKAELIRDYDTNPRFLQVSR